MAMVSALPSKLQFVPGQSLGESSLVLMRDCVHGCTYASKTRLQDAGGRTTQETKSRSRERPFRQLVQYAS